MSYAKAPVPGTGHGKRDLDRSRLRYNDHLTLSGIPPEAHEYVLGTRSGIDWIIDRYYIKTDKDIGHRQRPEPVGPGARRAALHRRSHQARRHRERAHRRDRRGIAEPRRDDCAAGGCWELAQEIANASRGARSVAGRALPSRESPLINARPRHRLPVPSGSRIRSGPRACRPLSHGTLLCGALGEDRDRGWLAQPVGSPTTNAARRRPDV